MDSHQDDGIFSQIKTVLKSGAWLGQVPWVYRIHDFMMPLIGNHLGVNARHGSIRNYAVDEVNRRKYRGSDHPDILGKLFKVHEEKPSYFSLTDVTSMAASNINAGSDTTAISLRAIIYYLLKNQGCKRKLLEEIESIIREGKNMRAVTLEQSQKMPYLQAVIYEALRLHPAVGMNLPRVTPAGGIVIDKYFIPEGVNMNTILFSSSQLTIIDYNWG